LFVLSFPASHANTANPGKAMADNINAVLKLNSPSSPADTAKIISKNNIAKAAQILRFIVQAPFIFQFFYPDLKNHQL